MLFVLLLVLSLLVLGILQAFLTVSVGLVFSVFHSRCRWFTFPITSPMLCEGRSRQANRKNQGDAQSE